MYEILNCMHKNFHMRFNEFENVSRSPSIVSLPLGHQKSTLPYSENSTIFGSTVRKVKQLLNQY